MRATDERRSINAKSHSSLELPDSSQGKLANPGHEASPLSQISLSCVWKKALDSGTVVSKAGSGDKLLASRKDGGGGVDNTSDSLPALPPPESEGG